MQALEAGRCLEIVQQCRIGIQHHERNGQPTFKVRFNGRKPAQSSYSNGATQPAWNPQAAVQVLETAHSACVTAEMQQEAEALRVVQIFVQDAIRQEAEALQVVQKLVQNAVPSASLQSAMPPGCLDRSPDDDATKET